VTKWVVLAVCAAWLLIGLVLGSQTALGMSMQGNPVPLAEALTGALVSSLPWIPATLVAIGMAIRFPIGASTWKRALPAHVVAVPVTSWIANLGVVLTFWSMSGVFNGWWALARQAAFWGTVRVHVALLVYLASYALTHGWRWVQDARARELRMSRLETQVARARFQALSAQIRPHFLFNTLHAIGLVRITGRIGLVRPPGETSLVRALGVTCPVRTGRRATLDFLLCHHRQEGTKIDTKMMGLGASRNLVPSLASWAVHRSQRPIASSSSSLVR
jgi:hypothetical protein